MAVKAFFSLSVVPQLNSITKVMQAPSIEITSKKKTPWNNEHMVIFSGNAESSSPSCK